MKCVFSLRGGEGYHHVAPKDDRLSHSPSSETDSALSPDSRLGELDERHH